jgi:hypothetical protein
MINLAIPDEIEFIPCIDCGLTTIWSKEQDWMDCTSDECYLKRHKFGVNKRIEHQERWRQLQNDIRINR